MTSLRLDALVTALLVAFVPSGSTLAAANPIIGTWRVTSGTTETCGTSMIFSPTSETDISPANSGYGGTHRVTYNISPAVVYVIGNTVNSVRYEFVGQNTMQARGERHACVYQRAGTEADAGGGVTHNPLFGAWVLVQPAPKGCYTAFRIGPDKTVGIDYSGEEWPLSIDSYDVHAGTVIAHGSAGAITYSVSGSTMRTGVPSCNYARR